MIWGTPILGKPHLVSAEVANLEWPARLGHVVFNRVCPVLDIQIIQVSWCFGKHNSTSGPAASLLWELKRSMFYSGRQKPEPGGTLHFQPKKRLRVPSGSVKSPSLRYLGRDSNRNPGLWNTFCSSWGTFPTSMLVHSMAMILWMKGEIVHQLGFQWR